VHLAALHFIPYCNLHRAETISVNVLGTQHVLDAAAASDVNRVVFVSTADVYQPSETPHSEDAPIETNNIYGLSKLAGEQLVRMWGADERDRQWSIVRLFNVIGPGETNPHVIPDICKALATSDVLSLGNTTPRRDYVFVEDVADVLAHLIDLEQPDVVVNLGTGRSWSVTDLVERMAALTGRTLTIETDAAKVRPTDRPRLEADVSRLRSLFPWATNTTLDDSIRAVLAEHKLD
jgi:UDP-glucose 4-epimerase